MLKGTKQLDGLRSCRYTKEPRLKLSAALLSTERCEPEATASALLSILFVGVGDGLKRLEGWRPQADKNGRLPFAGEVERE